MDKTTAQALEYDFRPNTHQIEVHGRKLNYVSVGEAGKPVLLLVHGIMGTWRNWIFNLLPFSDRFQVIAVDLPGFGDSEMPAEELTINGYVDTLKDFLGALGIDKVTLVGNSMGGQVGAVFSKRAPELLERVILVDPAGISTSTKLLQRLVWLAPLAALLFKIGPGLQRLIAYNKRLAAFFTKIVLWRPGKISGDLIMLLLKGIGKPGFAPALRTITHTTVAHVPGTFATETVIVWGYHDWLIGRGDAYRYAKLIPHATLEIMDDVGHIPMFETPERFNALLERHIAPTEQTAKQAA